MKITKQLRTETAHRLTNYQGRCAHLHGHSYLWEVTVQSSTGLDDKNMVMDFKDLKKAMHDILDPLDHALVLAPDDPLVLRPDMYHLIEATNGMPARFFQWHDNPTAESFASWALREIDVRLAHYWRLYVESPVRPCSDEITARPMPYFVSAVRVWETATAYAEATSGDHS